MSATAAPAFATPAATTSAPAAIAVARTPVSWTGRVVSGIPALFLAFDAVVKQLDLPAVAKTSAQLGLPVELAPGLGILLAACLALYLIPPTAPLGAVLLTGYLGGAVLTHLRVDDPWLSHTLVPIYVGALLWGGLYLRDPRVRALLAPR